MQAPERSVLHVLPHPGGGGETYVDLLDEMPGYRFSRVYLAPSPRPTLALARGLAVAARRARAARATEPDVLGVLDHPDVRERRADALDGPVVRGVVDDGDGVRNALLGQPLEAAQDALAGAEGDDDDVGGHIPSSDVYASRSRCAAARFEKRSSRSGSGACRAPGAPVSGPAASASASPT